jgi:hypothetical protein
MAKMAGFVGILYVLLRNGLWIHWICKFQRS